MSNYHELSAACRDAFIVLKGAIEIRYADGDVWKPEEDEREHPITHRLRAASLVSLTTDPPDEAVETAEPGLAASLREERRVNDTMRQFLIELEGVCRAQGMPKTVVGREVLTWLQKRLSE